MDGKDMTTRAKPPPRARRLGATGLVVIGLLTGGILAGSQVANAASTSPTSSASRLPPRRPRTQASIRRRCHTGRARRCSPTAPPPR